jgi:rod shape-determining protein MreB
MLNFLRKTFANTLYVRLSPERLSVLQVESNYLFADVPLVALEEKKGKKVVLACGKDALALANQPNVSTANGFKHPRTIIADFAVAERTLAYFVKQTQKSRMFQPSPLIVIHPVDEFEGGLTQVEIRALVELCAMVGARQVYVWHGRELTTHELETLSFPSNAGKLLFG